VQPVVGDSDDKAASPDLIQGDAPMSDEGEGGDDCIRFGTLKGGWYELGNMDKANWHGPEEELFGYPASREELTVLARHWLYELWEPWLWCWEHGLGLCGSQRRRGFYCMHRLDRLRSVLGDDNMAKVRLKVEAKLRKECGEEEWQAYLRNDTEWRDRQRAEAMMIDGSAAPEDISPEDL
jgi:hypothetical protein